MNDLPSHKTLAVYPGTFDPITMGHVDIIYRALNLFDTLTIAVAVNASKSPLFSAEERVALIKENFAHEPRIRVEGVKGLVVDYAFRNGAIALVRGIRAVSDFDYEFQLALANRKLNREVESVFLMPGFRWIYISSSMLKDIARNGGDVSELVPVNVNTAMKRKYENIDNG